MTLAALSDPTRRPVFERILAAPRPVTAIAESLPVSRPAVSHHVKVLKQAGLITGRRQHIMPPAGDVAQRLRAKLFGRPVDEANVARGEQALPAASAMLEGQLADHKWMMDAEFGLVDCAYCPALNVIEKSGLGLAGFRRWRSISMRVAHARPGHKPLSYPGYSPEGSISLNVSQPRINISA